MSLVRISAGFDESTPITIELTMPLAYWRAARKQIEAGESTRYECGQIMSAIRQGIEKAEAVYVVTTEVII